MASILAPGPARAQNGVGVGGSVGAVGSVGVGGKVGGAVPSVGVGGKVGAVGSVGVDGNVGVGGKVVRGVGVARTVGVGAPVNGVGVGVPAKGVGVAGVDVGTAVGIPGLGVAVGGAEVDPRPGVEVVDRVPVRVGVAPGTTVPSGGGVAKVPLAAAVGVGLARPLFGSEGESELHAPSKTARRSAVARNGLKKRMGVRVAKERARATP